MKFSGKFLIRIIDCNYYIPMIIDANDNFYMASPEKGMIKCVSIN